MRSGDRPFLENQCRAILTVAGRCVQNRTTQPSGGGLWSAGSLTMNDSLIVGNSISISLEARGVGAAYGGGKSTYH